MSNNQNINDIAKETLCVLKYFSNELLEQIPSKFLDYLKDLADKSYLDIKLNVNNDIENQQLSEECKDMISLIYYSYIADEKEKAELSNIWNLNENKYQKILSEKYNIDDMFKSNKRIENIEIKTNLPAKIEKENIFKKILNFLKEKLKK